MSEDTTTSTLTNVNGKPKIVVSSKDGETTTVVDGQKQSVAFASIKGAAMLGAIGSAAFPTVDLVLHGSRKLIGVTSIMSKTRFLQTAGIGFIVGLVTGAAANGISAAMHNDKIDKFADALEAQRRAQEQSQAAQAGPSK